MEFLFYFFSSISLIALVIYVWMIANYIIKWNTIEGFSLQNYSDPLKTSVSIIVAARNEEENILSLLKCLTVQNYPASLFEILIIDDHSEDKTAEVVNRFVMENKSSNIKLIQLQKVNLKLKNKKAAIQQGIQNSTGELIVTTDADCTMGSNWVKAIVSYFETHKPEMIVAPVVLTGKSFFQKLQQIEFMSLIAVTASAIKNLKPLMCNGANLAYTRKAFERAGGFDDNDSLASGDDTFLMFKIAELKPDHVHFLKSNDAVVSTPAQKTLSTFMHQRIRWASKTSSYNLPYVTLTGYLIAILNLVMVAIALLSLADQKFLSVLGIMFLVKLITDVIYILTASAFFKAKAFQVLLFSAFTAFLYPAYILIIALLSHNAVYHWKGRSHGKLRIKY